MTTKKTIRELGIRPMPIGNVKPNPRNARTHSKSQILQIAASIEEFGFTNPILVDNNDVVIAGHGRLAAAKSLGLPDVPTITIENLTSDQIRAYVLADNRLAQSAGWDNSILTIELQHLLSLEDIDIQVTGFDVPEIDLILEEFSGHESQQNEIIEYETGPTVTKCGDVWSLGKHRVMCGNSLHDSTFTTLMGSRRAAVVLTDPPYNVRIDGNVCGKGSIHHREFAMASGEMSGAEFLTFLNTSLRLLAKFSTPGSVHFIFMDWRHAAELLEAGKRCYAELLNLCVWVKSNGGMGSFYRSRHELVFTFRNGKNPHRNNIRLGRYGRNRTNVWEYPGVNALSRDAEGGKLLALHPTVKPVALVADALLDCSARGEVVLDSFLGSGTTLLAAERTGRHCYGIEIDPLYVDVAVRRWQRYTGERAIHQSGRSF